MIIAVNRLVIEENYLKIRNAAYEKPTADIISHDEKNESFFLISGTIYLLQCKPFLVNINWTDSSVCAVNPKLYTAWNFAHKFCNYRLILTFLDVNWHMFPQIQFSYWCKCHF